jgi:hypothetical protein
MVTFRGVALARARLATLLDVTFMIIVAFDTFIRIGVGVVDTMSSGAAVVMLAVSFS